jgi:hypothetical protein
MDAFTPAVSNFSAAFLSLVLKNIQLWAKMIQPTKKTRATFRKSFKAGMIKP